MSQPVDDKYQPGTIKSLARLPFAKYPLRVCRSWHHCCICSKDISNGESYRDGGYSRRAHVTCIERFEAS